MLTTVKMLRTVEIPTQEMVWNLFGDEKRPVQKIECERALIDKFGTPAKGIKFFWNFNHTGRITEKMTVGIEILGFEIGNTFQSQEGLVEIDESFLKRDEVLRREGALLSELERVGIFLMGNA